ncbi:MAG: DUF3656 domain-containing protein [Lachnospirales bacterium]
MIKPEILAPTGTYESVVAALNGGCNAIYIGGKLFSARAYANNPSDDELKEIILICHLRGVKVFVTINTLYKEEEISEVIKFVSKIYSFGAYGVIVQDIGLAKIIKDNFPNIMISASTQMTTHNLEGVKFLSKLGYKRVVLARELSEIEINYICQNKGDTEIEGFIHGALCVCYSGRCLMSSFIGGRSGNRGRCAQPCRMEYSLYKNDNNIKKGFLLSPRDISTIEVIDKVVNSGLDSLKIEGRMKSPEYVYEVVSTYRKYIDNNFNKIDKTDLKNLTQIFNRGGKSSEGYFSNYSGKNMMSILSPKHSGMEIGVVESYNPKNKKCVIKLFDNVVCGDGIEIWSKPHCGTGINKIAKKGDIITVTVEGRIKKGDKVFKSFDKELNDNLKKTYNKIERKRTVNTEIYFKENEVSKIKFTDFNIEVFGDIPQKAQNKPMTKEDIIKRIKKTGETAFDFNITKAQVDDNIYMAVSLINNLRRNACESLENYLKNSLLREEINVKIEKKEVIKSKNPQITVMVRNKEQFNAAIDSLCDIIYCEVLDTSLSKMAKEKGKKFYYALPDISRDGYESYIKILDITNCDGYIVRSLGEINTEKEIITDFTLNITNSFSIKRIREIYNNKIVSLSTELTKIELSEIADENCEIVVYGRLPLMTTNQCPVGLYEGNKNNKKYCSLKNSKDFYYLKDRKGEDYPLMRDCERCICHILDSSPIHTLDIIDDVSKIGAGFLRIELTNEDYENSLNIINSYIKRENLNINKSSKGHFIKGVM